VQAALKKAGVIAQCASLYGALECPMGALSDAVEYLPALWITVPSNRGSGSRSSGGSGLVDLGLHGLDLWNCQGTLPHSICNLQVGGGSGVVDDKSLLLGDTFLRAYGQVYSYGNTSMGFLPAVPWSEARPSWYELPPVKPWYKEWYVWVAVVFALLVIACFVIGCMYCGPEKSSDADGTYLQMADGNQDNLNYGEAEGGYGGPDQFQNTR